MSDFVGNAIKTIESGLSKDDALKAFTWSAADLMGVGTSMGSLEVGKIANLVVARGDLFEKGTRITHVFIDGVQVDLRPAPAAPPAQSGGPAGGPGVQPPAGAAMNAAGIWTITITFGDQSMPGTMTIQQDGSQLTGTLVTAMGTSQINNGRVTAEGLSFTSTAEVQGQSMNLNVTGTVKGNEISGTINSNLGTASFTGTKP
jgi:hypothetical protein